MSRSSSRNPFDCESSGGRSTNPFDEDAMAPLTSAKVSNVGPYKNSESRAPSQAGSKETGRKNHKLRNILQSLDQSMESNGSSSSIVAVDIEDENAVVRFLISSRVYGYPNSDGSVMSNYRHFVYNNHPLISIFFAKRGHPYNTKKRFIVYICIICFAIGLSYLFLNTNYVHEVTVCREGCNLPPSNSAVSIADHCYGGYNDGLPFGSYNKYCEYYQSWMLSASCGAILVPYGTLLQFLATCGCVQGRDFFKINCFGTRVKYFLEFCGGNILSFSLSVSFLIILWAVLETYYKNTGYYFLQLLLISKAWSTCGWFIWTLPYFSYRFPKDKIYFYKNILNEKSDRVDDVDGSI